MDLSIHKNSGGLVLCWFCRAPMTDGYQLRSFDGILRVVPTEWNDGVPMNGAGPHTCNEHPPSPAELRARGIATLRTIQDIALEAMYELAPPPPKKRWMGWY